MVDLIPINRRKMNTNQPTNQPTSPQSGQADSLAYTATLVRDSEAFEAFVRLTQYYTKICPS